MRKYCSNCHFPESTCLCGHIKSVPCSVSIIVLQHPKESTHAKNTVKLLKLAIPDTRIIIGKTSTEFEQIASAVSPENSGVVYPSDKSVALDTFHQSNKTSNLKQLLFIDGSWRQAYGIWQSNVWLHTLPQFHLNNAPRSKYEIRHVKSDNSLSTLEAVSHALSTISGTDMTPLIQLQSAFQKNWLSPASHRRK